MALTPAKIASARPLSEYVKGLVINVNDKMQHDYSYTLKEDAGKNLGFVPGLSPGDALAMGIMDGKYLRDCYDEFPREWFANGKFAKTKSADPSVNYFGISSRQSLQEWKRKNWIPLVKGDDDIRGWFQWYCRFWLGRRDPNVDALQIKRHKAIARHKGAVVKNCPHAKNKKGQCSDMKHCRPKQRQTLLNWCWDPIF